MGKKRGKPVCSERSGSDRESLERRIRELEALNKELKLENIVLRREIQIRKPPECGRRTELRRALGEILNEWRGAFARGSVFARTKDLALGFLLNLGRRTLTGALSTLGRQFEDWSAAYRTFSEARFEPEALFAPLLRRCVERSKQPFFAVAIDDSQLRKTGKKIAQARILRDPLSPPYHPNLRWCLRFLQISALLSPAGFFAPARGIPIAFRLAPSVRKPGRRASAETWQAYERDRKERTLGRQAAALVREQRAALDAIPGAATTPLLICADGAMANRAFLRDLPDRTEFLARVREDAALFAPANSEDKRRVYGERLPTPNELRADERFPWKRVEAYAVGKLHRFRIKDIRPVLWKHTTGRRPLRLIIIAPLHYRPSQGHRLLYRKAAYLLTSDLRTPAPVLLQTYINRWEIEVNFRDDKTLLGIGQAQVRNRSAVERVPAFVVAAYGALLLASLVAFGSQRTGDYLPLLSWRKDKPRRPSTEDLLARLRQEAWIPPEPGHSYPPQPPPELPRITHEALNAMLTTRR